jgi:RCC1 and BTB domain-containing protein
MVFSNFISNSIGVLGDGTTVNSFVLKSVLVEPSVLQGVLVRDVRVSSRFGILLSKSGQVYAWGSNMYGNIGLGTFDSKIYPPTEVFGALKGNIITDIAVNEDNALALDDKGVVYAWGANTYGTLVSFIKKYISYLIGRWHTKTKRNRNCCRRSTKR